DAVAQCLNVLEALVADPTALTCVDAETRNRLVSAAGRVSRPTRAEQKLFSRAVHQKKKNQVREADRAALERTGIRQKRLDPVFGTPEPAALVGAHAGVYPALRADSPAGQPLPEGVRPPAPAADRATEGEPTLNTARSCYVCKVRCNTVHFFYDQMCPTC